MTPRTAALARRHSRPVLLGLVLLMLFLPFVTVSCSSPLGDELEITFSGYDGLLGSDPSISGVPASEPSPADPDDFSLPGLARFTGGLALIALLLGIAGTYVGSTSRRRSIIAATGSGVAMLAMVINQMSLRAYLQDEISESDLARLFTLESRGGFWLTLLYLLAFTSLNVALLVSPEFSHRVRRRFDDPGSG